MIQIAASPVTEKARIFRHKFVYTWRDWAMMLWFSIMAASSYITLTGDKRLLAYGISAAIIGSIGFMSVLLKLKRVESLMIVTMGLLLMSRGVLLLPTDVIADNTSVLDYIVDVVHIRPLLDGMAAILPLSVLSVYRERRGRISK